MREILVCKKKILIWSRHFSFRPNLWASGVQTVVCEAPTDRCMDPMKEENFQKAQLYV
jgi:hypothetical protein